MDREKDILKVLKLNQEIISELSLKNDISLADKEIADSEELLKFLGYSTEGIVPKADNIDFNITVCEKDFEELANEANAEYENIDISDILDENELNAAYNDIDRIHRELSEKTSIINKTDLYFLGTATAIQVCKALITPSIAEKFNYGKGFDGSTRLKHNDSAIEKAHKAANDKFKEKHKNHKNGYWQNILYQTPAYDITKGSRDINFNMGGKYHRLYTLGHDPILGWVFGTANILTDIITLSNMKSYRVTRNPMRITPQRVSMPIMLKESLEAVQDDFLNLPAALFAQYRHYKSDAFTKQGLPVPLLEAFAPEFAGKLYKSQYDALCLQRDVKIVSTSAAVSAVANMIISLIHGLFYNPESGISRDLYEVRTRKILLISNSIASTSNIIYSAVTRNPKNLDIGGLFITIARLFSDSRFMARVKQEYIENELNGQLQNELNSIDGMLSKYQSRH